MKGQLSLFDVGDPDIQMDDYLNAPEPLCYGCEYAVKRGAFRLCQKGGVGYKHLNSAVYCDKYAPITVT